MKVEPLKKIAFKEREPTFLEKLKRSLPELIRLDDFKGRRGRRGLRGEKGETGKSVKGEPGESVTGDPGKRGKRGEPGKSVTGDLGKRGLRGYKGIQGRASDVPGPKGPPGLKGDTGPAPAHQWQGGSLRFKKPNGDWGKLVSLLGPAGGRGAGASAKQTWDSITLSVQNLIFSKPKAGPLGPTINVDLSSLAGLKNFVVVTTVTHDAGAEDVIYVDDDTAGGPVNISLPPAADGKRVYYVKKRGSTATVTVTGDGTDQVEGAPTLVLIIKNQSVTLHSDLIGWSVL